MAMNSYIKVINQVLYFAFDTIDKFFRAFGFTWVGIVASLAMVSVVLRLFAANLVGSAVPAMHEGATIYKQQRTEKQKARQAAGLGKSSVRLAKTAYKNQLRRR